MGHQEKVDKNTGAFINLVSRELNITCVWAQSACALTRECGGNKCQLLTGGRGGGL